MGTSLRTQHEAIRGYAASRGLPLADHIWQDGGESARSFDRPALQGLLGRLGAGRSRGIIVASVDRLSRHVGDLVGLVEDHFTEKGDARLHSATESVDTKTAAGRCQLYMLAVFGQYMREHGAEATCAVMKTKRQSRERVGTVPFGQMVDPADSRVNRRGNRIALVPCPADLAIEAEIRRMREVGLSYRAIASGLNERRIPSKRGVTRRSTGLWSKSSVASVLARDPHEPNPAMPARDD